MGETGGDFLDVVGDENHRRTAAAAEESGNEGEEGFPGDGIKSGTRFIQKQEARVGHQGAGQQRALPLAFGELDPGAGCAAGQSDGREESAGTALGGRRKFAPWVEHGAVAAEHGREGGGLGCDQPRHPRADDADVFPQFAPVAPAELPAQQMDVPTRWSQIAGERRKQGALTRAVEAQDHPVLAPAYGPVESVEDGGGATDDTEAPDVQQGSGWSGGHGWARA